MCSFDNTYCPRFPLDDKLTIGEIAFFDITSAGLLKIRNCYFFFRSPVMTAGANLIY